MNALMWVTLFAGIASCFREFWYKAGYDEGYDKGYEAGLDNAIIVDHDDESNS